MHRRHRSNSRCCRSRRSRAGCRSWWRSRRSPRRPARRARPPRTCRRRRTAAATSLPPLAGAALALDRQGGFQRAAANPNVTTPAAASAFRDDNNDDAGGGGNANAAADGLLINGSVNNGAASPFAQARAFGNNRPGGRGLYNGGVGLLNSNSAFDSRPFAFNGQSAPKPSYNDVHFVANFGGPIRIPKLLRRGPNFFGNFQHVRDHNATTQ